MKPGNTKLARRFAGACVAIALLLVVPPAQAFSIGNPFKAVGNALGSVARGVGNIFGQGLAGLAGPTISTFTDEANKLSAEIIAKVDAMAEKRINQVDAVLGNRINQIDGVMAKNIDVVDKIMGTRIADFDKLLDEKIGAVDIVATKAIQNAEDSFIRVIRYAAVLLLIAALVGLLAYLVITRFRTLPPDSIQIGAATTVVAALVVFGASFFLTPPAGEKIQLLAADFSKAARASYRSGELNDAVTYTKQLTVVYPTNPTYQIFHKITEVQRDLFYRPTMIKSVQGANALLPRVRRIGELVDDIGLEKQTDEFSGFLRHEASATAAIVLWQLANTREEERLALCAAADALGDLTPSPTATSDKATPATWLAYSYLRWSDATYLGNAAEFNCRKGKETTQFKALRAKAEGSLQAFDAAFDNRPDSIRSILFFNRESTNYFREASRLYTGLIVHDAQSMLPTTGTRTDAIKKNHRDERDKLASLLVANWINFTEKMVNDGAVKSSDIILAATGLPAAMAIRAQRIRDLADGPPRALTQAGCADTINKLKTTAFDGKDPLAALGRLYSEKVRNLLCVEQVYFDGALTAAETDLKSSSSRDEAQEKSDQSKMAIARAEVLTSLVTCIKENATNLLGHASCTTDELKTEPLVPFVQWLTRGPQPAPAPAPPPEPRYAMVR
jgi:hypothetical protein